MPGGRVREAGGAEPTRRLWVITECYPRPAAPRHCAFAHRLTAGVARAGWDVRVLLPNGWFPPLVWRLVPAWRAAARAHIPRGWCPDGVPVADLRVQNRVPSRLARPLDYGARVATALRRTLAEHGARPSADVLLTQFALPYGPAVRTAAAGLGLPYVVHLRGDDVWLWSRQSAEAQARFGDTLRDAALVLGVSASLIDEARRVAGGHLPPAAVVPNGIQLDRFRPAASPHERSGLRRRYCIREDALVILCSAQPLVRKGWAELLDALGDLSRIERPLVLVAAIGTAPAPEVDVVAEAGRRAPRLVLHPVRDADGDRLAELLRAADVFVLPTHSEGMSNAVLEAMATGLPVLTTAVGGHPEAIADGVDGLLVPPRSVERLRDALARLIGDAGLRTELGRSARERAERIGDVRAAGARLSMLIDAVRRGVLGRGAELMAGNPYGAPEAPSVGTERDGRAAPLGASGMA